MKKNFILAQNSVTLTYLILQFTLFACRNQDDGSDPSSTAPDSFDGIKWGTPFAEAYKMCKQQRLGNGEHKVFLYTNGNDDALTARDYYTLSLDNYVYEGVPGKMVYEFTPDSIVINQKPPRFESASFVFERQSISIPGSISNSLELQNKYVSNQLHLNYLKIDKWVKKIDSLCVSKYGPSNPDPLYPRDKRWKWNNKCVIYLVPPSEDLKEAGSASFRISTKPSDTRDYSKYEK